MYRDRDRAITRSFLKLRIGIGISILFFRFIAIGIAIPKFVDRLQAWYHTEYCGENYAGKIKQ